MRMLDSTGPGRAAGAPRVGQAPLTVVLSSGELANCEQTDAVPPACHNPAVKLYFPHSTSQAGQQTPERGQCRELSAHPGPQGPLVNMSLDLSACLQKPEKNGDQLFHLQLKPHQCPVLFLKLSQEEFFPVANFIQFPILALKVRKR